jgi:hypothetical protein
MERRRFDPRCRGSRCRCLLSKPDRDRSPDAASGAGYARKKPTALSQWINDLLDRRPTRLVTVAIANKLARIACAVMVRGERFRNEGAVASAAA